MAKIRAKTLLFILILFFLSCRKQRKINYKDFKNEKYSLIYYNLDVYGTSYNLSTDLLEPIVPNTQVKPCFIELSASKRDSIVQIIEDLNLLEKSGFVEIEDKYEHLPVFSSTIQIYQDSIKISEFKLALNPKNVLFSPQKRRIIKLFNTLGRMLNENIKYKNKQIELNKFQKENSIFAI